ncbi:hypothetical protein SAMN05216563_105301 [Phytobacter palmae]|nr:hypothetical protein SAMN05216563_105301 [Phytobacter palmae]
MNAVRHYYVPAEEPEAVLCKLPPSLMIKTVKTTPFLTSYPSSMTLYVGNMQRLYCWSKSKKLYVMFKRILEAVNNCMDGKILRTNSRLRISSKLRGLFSLWL